MAAGFGHRWQGMALGSLAKSEVLEIGEMLASLLEQTMGAKPLPRQDLASLSKPDLILAVWRLDLALDKFRPLAPPSRTAQGKPIPLVSTWNRSPRPTARPATDSTASGTKDTFVGAWWIGPPTPPRGE